MRCFAVLLLAASVLAEYENPMYSFDAAVGSASGTGYTIEGEGQITGVRVWERYSSYIYGLQLRYGLVWSPVAGRAVGDPLEFELMEDEAIIQVSGKYSHYINSLVFVTNMGRSMFVGQPSGTSFNMYARTKGTELVIISGRYHGALTSLGTHWATVPQHNTKALM